MTYRRHPACLRRAGDYRSLPPSAGSALGTSFGSITRPPCGLRSPAATECVRPITHFLKCRSSQLEEIEVSASETAHRTTCGCGKGGIRYPLAHDVSRQADSQLGRQKTNGHLSVAVVCGVLYLPCGRTPTPGGTRLPGRRYVFCTRSYVVFPAPLLPPCLY